MNTKTPLSIKSDIKSDIKSGGWIRFLPASFRPYAVLARLDRPVGIWLLLLPGWWAVVLASGGVRNMNAQDWFIFALFGLGAVVMRAAGCVVNDFWDRDLDKQVERTRARPLAAGAVKVKQALVFLGVLLCIGLGVLLQMNGVTIALGVLSLPLIAIYPLMKRFTWWPQLVLGIVFNFGALMGWSAVSGLYWPHEPFLLYAGGVFWTLGYDTIYAQQDAEDDALIGVKSTARLFGGRSKIWVAGFFAAAWVLIFAASGFNLLLFLPAVHLAWQVKAWRLDDAASSLRIFRSNRNFGLLVLAALAV